MTGCRKGIFITLQVLEEWLFKLVINCPCTEFGSLKLDIRVLIGTRTKLKPIKLHVCISHQSITINVLKIEMRKLLILFFIDFQWFLLSKSHKSCIGMTGKFSWCKKQTKTSFEFEILHYSIVHVYSSL